MKRLPNANLTEGELERFRCFETEALPVFGDIIAAHTWLARFSPRVGGGSITRREAIRESDHGLQEVLLELQSVSARHERAR